MYRVDELRFQVTKGKWNQNPETRYTGFYALLRHCMFERPRPAWDSWRLRRWENPAQKSRQVTNFPFVVHLYAENYISICHRTLQAFTHERLYLNSDINFGHGKATYIQSSEVVMTYGFPRSQRSSPSLR